MADEFDWQGTLQLAVDVSPCLPEPLAPRPKPSAWRWGRGEEPMLFIPDRAARCVARLPAQTGSCYAAMAFDTEGTFYGSYPLDAEGNYKHNV